MKMLQTVQKFLEQNNKYLEDIQELFCKAELHLTPSEHENLLDVFKDADVKFKDSWILPSYSDYRTFEEQWDDDTIYNDLNDTLDTFTVTEHLDLEISIDQLYDHMIYDGSLANFDIHKLSDNDIKFLNIYLVASDGRGYIDLAFSFTDSTGKQVINGDSNITNTALGGYISSYGYALDKRAIEFDVNKLKDHLITAISQAQDLYLNAIDDEDLDLLDIDDLE